MSTNKLQFLDLLETMNASDAAMNRLYSKGDIRVGRRSNPKYLRALAEATTLVSRVISGTAPIYRLQEAMSTSDFPILFGDILDRQLLGNYRETPQTYPAYTKIDKVRDFRTVKRYTVDGGVGQLEPVGEYTEYPEASLSEGFYQFNVNKYGRRFPFTWETMINDDLNALTDIPARMGRASRRTEEKFVTAMFAGNLTFFSSGNGNILTGNPVPSIAAVQALLTLLSTRRDSDGEPIITDMVHIVAPPSLEIIFNNIMNATELWITEGSTDVHTTNWMKGRFQLHINQYLPIVDTVHGSTAWYMFADPGTSRPAMVMAFLRGHETPEMFMKSPNTVSIGGANADAMNGDFDVDAIHYKVRHVMGGTMMDPKAAVMSNGSGS